MFSTVRVLILPWTCLHQNGSSILKSLAKPDTYYVGLTANIRRRLETHNEASQLTPANIDRDARSL